MLILKSKASLIVCSILLLVFNASTVNGASWRECLWEPIKWPNNRTTMNLSTTSFPPGNIWNLQTQYKMYQWNSVGGSNFSFYVGSYSGSHGFPNHRNEVYFLHEPDKSHLGHAYYFYTCHVLPWPVGTVVYYTESDIKMNTASAGNPPYVWTQWDFTGANVHAPFNFELVMLHELGHALGLEHWNTSPAIMNSRYFMSGPQGHYHKVEPHADDRHGLRILYPSSSSERNVSVSRFHPLGDGFSNMNTVTDQSGDHIFSLTKGVPYNVLYTLQNLGTVHENVRIEFYLSTNRTISTSDIYLGASIWNMPAASYVTANKSFTVPASVPPGDYYVGYIADPNGTIPQTDTTNSFVSLLYEVTIK